MIDWEAEFEIWSQYQEWGRTGTALSFFVPERRVVSRNPEITPSISLAKLPADPSDWPELEWQSQIGNLVAGISQLNPELIMNIAETIEIEDEEIFHAHGLPADRENLLQLAEEIEQVRRTAERFSHFRLDWNSF